MRGYLKGLIWQAAKKCKIPNAKCKKCNDNCGEISPHADCLTAKFFEWLAFQRTVNWPAVSTARKILGNTAAQIGGKLATAAASMIVIKLLTNYLGLAGYGQYTTVYEFLAFFAIAADFGIFQIAVRDLSQTADGSTRDRIFGNILGLRLLLTVAALVAAVAAVWLIPKYAATWIPLGVAVAAATTFFNLVHGTLSAPLQTEHRIQWAVVAQVVGKFVTLGYMAAVILWWWPHDPKTGFLQVLVAGNVGLAVTTGLTWLAARRIVATRPRFEWQFWRQVLLRALPYGLAVILGTIYFRLDVILLSLLRTQTEVGIYGVAMRILENLQMLPVFFLNALLPVLAQQLAAGSTKLQSTLQLAFDFLCLIGLPLLAGGWLLARPLTLLISSPAFVGTPGHPGSETALTILLGAMLLAFFSNLFGYTLLAASQQTKLLWINFGAVIFNIISNLIIIPRFGFVGAATTSVISELLVCVAGGWLVWRLTHFRPQLALAGKALLSAVGMAAALQLGLAELAAASIGPTKSLAVLLPVGGVVYAALLFATRAVTPQMLKMLRRPTALASERDSG